MKADIYIKGMFNMGCIYLNDEDYRIIPLDGFTDNQCEWITTVSGLTLYEDKDDIDEINIYMDSKLVYKQLIREAKTKSKSIKKFYLRLAYKHNLLRDKKINYIKIDRDKNPARTIIVKMRDANGK